MGQEARQDASSTVDGAPVSLILSTPAATNRRATRSTSSVDRSCEFGVRSTPSAGMQYWHLRLHLRAQNIRAGQSTHAPLQPMRHSCRRLPKSSSHSSACQKKATSYDAQLPRAKII